jgi:hypothetical protein
MLRALATGLLTRKLMTGLSRRSTTRRGLGRAMPLGMRRTGGALSNPLVQMAGMAAAGYMANRMMRGRGRTGGGLAF